MNYFKQWDFGYLQEESQQYSMTGAHEEPLDHSTQIAAYSAGTQSQPDRTGQSADSEIKEANTSVMKVGANFDSLGGK